VESVALGAFQAAVEACIDPDCRPTCITSLGHLRVAGAAGTGMLCELICIAHIF
jgi:hypothetical protein